MIILAFLLMSLGPELVYSALLGKNPLDVARALVGNGIMPNKNTWLNINSVASYEATTVSTSIGDAATSIGSIAAAGGGGTSRSTVVGAALAQQGKPYIWDTPASASDPNPKSFDCSGLTMWCYHKVGIPLPHYTGLQDVMGVPVPLSQAQAGDLIFWRNLEHVAIYLGNGKIIHAPHTGTVVQTADLFDQAHAYVRSLLNTGAEKAA